MERTKIRDEQMIKYIENAGQHTFTGICAISTTCWNPDANEDGIVGMTDLLQLLAWFGTNSPVCD